MEVRARIRARVRIRVRVGVRVRVRARVRVGVTFRARRGVGFRGPTGPIKGQASRCLVLQDAMGSIVPTAGHNIYLFFNYEIELTFSRSPPVAELETLAMARVPLR